jgi:GT2 family glycosyltransferase
LLQEKTAECESLRQQLNAESERLQAATENLRVLTEAHSKFQSSNKSLREVQSKLEDSRAKLEESHENLKKDHQQTLRQLQTASEFIEKISRTKAWRTVEFWWKSKLKVISWLPQKQARFKALHNTSSFILQSEGSAALVNRTYRFLRGERRNNNVNSNSSPTAFLPNGEVQTNEAPVVETTYEQWIQRNEPTQFALELQAKHELNLEYRQLISIITPVYNTDEAMLRKMINSVLQQTYSNWELCLVDGCSAKPHVRLILEEYARQYSRIRVKYLNDNLGISGNSNEAVNMAAGEFIALLDHDDELTPNALYENVLLLNRHQDADMIYSDEDKLDAEGARCHPFFKPDWSPDLFRSIMYTCHFGVYRTALVKSVGAFRNGFDGSQDHDLVLRLTEKTTRIHHIPKILYHWRMSPGSTALDSEAKGYAEAARLKAVQEHCERRGLKGIAEPGLFNGAVRLRYLPEINPLVSIIIPTRDRFGVLRQCVNSILKLSTYENYEILIVDNDSSERQSLDYLSLLEKQPKVRVIKFSGKFNFSAINNFAAAQAKGELLLFLNNDTEVISADWLEAMIEHAVRPEVGAVGARLMYPNNTVQHAGVIIGMGGIAGHAHINLPSGDPGYFGRVHLVQNFSAVTGACLMTKAELFKDLGGFNEQNLAVAFNDVDFCLRLREKNLLVVYTPYAELYHYESLSRGSDLSPQNIERFKREIEYTESKWHKIICCDPYYNPNLSLDLSLGTFTLAPFSRTADAATFETQQPERL